MILLEKCFYNSSRFRDNYTQTFTFNENNYSNLWGLSILSGDKIDNFKPLNYRINNYFESLYFLNNNYNVLTNI